MIRKSRIRRLCGFTLVEVLLVLALVGVLVGLVAGNVGAFITGAQYEPPDRVLRKAILDAIYLSAEYKYSTYLSYNEENASFRVSNSSGRELSSHSVYEGKWKEKYESPEVEFEAIGPESGVNGGATLYDDEQLEIQYVPFEYGASVPFLAKIRFRGESSELKFDPFSGYLMEQEE